MQNARSPHPAPHWPSNPGFRLRAPLLESTDRVGPCQSTVDLVEPVQDRVVEAMRLTKGRRQQAAGLLGLSRSALWRWLREGEREAQPATPDAR